MRAVSFHTSWWLCHKKAQKKSATKKHKRQILEKAEVRWKSNRQCCRSHGLLRNDNDLSLCNLCVLSVFCGGSLKGCVALSFAPKVGLLDNSAGGAPEDHDVCSLCDFQLVAPGGARCVCLASGYISLLTERQISRSFVAINILLLRSIDLRSNCLTFLQSRSAIDGRQFELPEKLFDCRTRLPVYVPLVLFCG